MTLVTAQISLSLDGFYAGPRHAETDGWMESPGGGRLLPDHAMGGRGHRMAGAPGLRARRARHQLRDPRQAFESAGAYVMGRRMADGGEVPWGDEPPFHAPVFVVTHRARETLERKGGTSFTYVTDGLETAIDQARAAAKGKDVAIAGGGTLLRQVIKSGMLDQLDLHIAPVLVGDGMRLFDPADLCLAGNEAIELTPTRVIEAPDVTHLRYQIEGRSALSGDAPD